MASSSNTGIFFSETVRKAATSRVLDKSYQLFEPSDFSISCDKIQVIDQICCEHNHTLCRAEYQGSPVDCKIMWLDKRNERLINMMVDLSVLRGFRHQNIVSYYGSGFTFSEDTLEMQVSQFFNIKQNKISLSLFQQVYVLFITLSSSCRL